MDKASIKPVQRSLRIVLIYAAVGTLWILLSDRLMFSLTSDPATLANAAILKGLFYVAATAGMLYWLIYRDLDAVRLAENALRESEEHYRTLFETTPVGLGVADESGNLLTCNHALLGPGSYTRHDIAQIKNLARLCANRDEGETILATTRQQGFLHQREVQFKRKDNTTYTVLLSLTPIQMKEHLGWQVVIEDITQRKQAEEILRESEERLKLVLEGSNDGFWDWNLTTGVVQFSLRWAEMLGYRLDEIEPHVRTWERLIHPDDQPAVMQSLDDHLEGRTPQYETEHRLLTQSGEWKWISDRGKVVTRDEHGQPLRMTGMHTDITERKRAEEEARRRLREMALLNRVIAATTSTLDERTVLQTVCEELGHAFEVPHCAAGLPTADGLQVTIVAEYRLPTRLSVIGVVFPVKGAVAEYILEHPEPLTVADAQADPRFSFIAPLLAQQGDVSLLVIPILMREQAIALLP